MTVERRRPLTKDPERPTLESFLAYQRATLLTKCAGLSTELLKTRAVPVSTLSLLGLVRHCTENELFWFGAFLTGSDRAAAKPYTRHRADADFDALDDTDVTTVFDRFRSACAASDAAAGAVDSLDRLSVGDWDGKRFGLRWIYLHMIQEYSRHNGHADLVRQSLDGATGL